VVLLDLDRAQFLQLLPGTPRLAQMGELVRFFIGDEMRWDLELRLAPRAAPPLRLARGARLGWSTWLGRRHRGPTRSRIRDTHIAPRPVTHSFASPPRETQHG
jgi:type VI secretion system protein ImpH